MAVYIVPTDTIPVAGRLLQTANRLGTYYNKTSWQLDSIVIDTTGIVGKTKRLVFSWRNDYIYGTDPPAAIDNIHLITSANPISGIKTIKNSGGDFRNLTEAVNFLNKNGLGSGGVTFLIESGETFNEPAPISILTTGTSSDRIIFKRNGSGSRPVINVTGTEVNYDACIKLSGCDYITFDSLDVRNAGTSVSNYCESGFSFISFSGTNGCQYDTVRNCIIKLDSVCSVNYFTNGVYFQSYATSFTGTNSNNAFLNDSTTYAVTGYYLYGKSITNPDTGNFVGSKTGKTSYISRIRDTGISLVFQSNCHIFNCDINSINSSNDAFGIYTTSSSNLEIKSCNIYNVSSTGAKSAHGINIGIVSGTVFISGNKINSISTKLEAIGINIGSETGTSVNTIYNNIIYDIKAPNSTYSISTCGIAIKGGTTDSVFHNTVYLDYISENSSNTSAAIYVSSFPTSVDLRNNIFVNKTNVTIGTRAAAFIKSSTSLTNISSFSNNNLYYSGNPSLKNCIFYNGTNTDSTIAQYKTRLAPKDSAAFTENPAFKNISEPYDLHIDTVIYTRIESGGKTAVFVNKDFDGRDRYPNPGYPVNPLFPATAPDVGAFEFGGGKGTLRGNYTIRNSGGNYSSFTSAIADLNTYGSGAGGVTFLVQSGAVFYEPSQLIINATGYLQNPVVFKRDGAGARPVIWEKGTSSTSDACFRLNSCDYITFDSLDIRDSGSSTSNYADRCFYFANSSTDGCRNNTIKNCRITMHKTNSYSYGIYTSSVAASSDATNSNNSFYNNYINNCYDGFYLYGVSSYPDTNNVIGSTGTSNLNKIFNLGGGSLSVFGIYAVNQKSLQIFQTEMDTLNGTGSVFGIYTTGTNASVNVFSNLIHGISSSSATGQAIGLYLYSSLINTVYKNKIYDISISGTGSTCDGLVISRGINLVYNNFIYDIRGTKTAVVSSPPVNGIRISTAGGPDSIFHNTVYLDYVSDTSSNMSSAINLSSSTTNVDLRNNIFVNLVNVNKGSKAAAFYCYANTSAISPNTNNNLYFAGTPSLKNLIFFNGSSINDSTIFQYKTRLFPIDSNAVWQEPPFYSKSPPYELFIRYTDTTLVEGGGKITSLVTDDFDGNARYPYPGYEKNFLFPPSGPDIGADEFPGRVDRVPPVITYSALLDSVSAPTRKLTNVVITDALKQVDISSAGRPRCYYKKTTDTNAFIGNTSASKGWKYVKADGSGGSPFTFTINYSLLFGGSVSTGDTIQYFVAANDNVSTQNTKIEKGLYSNKPFSVDLNPFVFPVTGSINSYSITLSFAGSFYVGTGQTYPTLTAAVNDYNSRTITGPIEFLLIDTLYGPNERFPITIKRNGGASSNNALWIRPYPSDKNVRITGRDTSIYKILIRFEKAAYIKLSGYSSYSPGRHITIMDSSGGVPVSIGSIDTSTRYVTVEYCNLITPRNDAFSGNQYGVYMYGNNYGTAIQNNEITKSYVGIYNYSTSGFVNKKFYISGNIIGSKDTSKRIIRTGISISADSSSISGNEIFNMNDYGIYFQGSQSTISGNKIYDIGNNEVSMLGSGGKGIFVSNSFGIDIINNSIFGIKGIGSDIPQYSIAGIFLENTVQYANLFYNSVNLYGNISRPEAVSDKSFALYSNLSALLNLKNNILINGIQNLSGNSSAYSFYNASALLNSLYSINYNDYYVSGNQGILGYHNGNRTTLSEWKTATGKDSNSFSENPYFIADTNLQLSDWTNLFHSSTSVPGISDDILGILRHSTTPSIGAYENFLDVYGPRITYTQISNNPYNVLTDFAVITDISGIQTSPGLKPRFYFKRNYDTNAFIGNYSYNKGWKYAEASGTTSPFSFTIDYSKLYNNSGGTMKPGDIVEYFVVAQDLYYAGSHVSSNPQNGFIGTSVSNITRAPNPNHYAIVSSSSPLSGSYDVGLEAFNLASGKNLYHKQVSEPRNADNKNKNPDNKLTEIYDGDKPYKGPLKTVVSENASKFFLSSTVYASLSGAIEDLKENGISGNVIFFLSDPYYTSELFPILIDSIKGSNDIFTIKIKPKTGINPTITGTNTESLFDFSKTKRIIIDGANTSGGTSKNLTIINLDTNGSVFQFRDNSSYDTIKNCIIRGSTRSYRKGVVFFAGSSGFKGNSDNVLLNCDVGNSTKPPYNAVYSINTQGKCNYNLEIINCNIYNWSDYGVNLSDTSSYPKYGQYLIQENSFYNNLSDTPAVSQTAIYINPNYIGDTIKSNFIGGTLPECGGNYWANKSNATFTGILLSYLSNKYAYVEISNNIIQNILLTKNSNSCFTGIKSYSGCSVKGNLIGSDIIEKGVRISGTDAINSGSNIDGIYVYYQAANSVYNQISIDSNIITNLFHTSNFPGTTTGIYLMGNPPVNFVNGNRIYNIGVTSNSLDSNSISGICLELYNPVFYYDTTVISNNMISLGLGITNNNEYFGINDRSLGNRLINICNNSVLIGGTSNGYSNSQVYFHYNNSGISILNNIFYNERKGGIGKHLSINVEFGSITNSNYNMYVSGSKDTVANWKGTICNIDKWKLLSGGDKNSYYYTSSDALSSLFFSDAVNGILSIITSNSVCWYSASKGYPLVFVRKDYFGNARSVSIASGPVCIGAYEFLPVCSPPALIQSGPPVSGDTTFYKQGERKIMEIIWGTDSVKNDAKNNK